MQRLRRILGMGSGPTLRGEQPRNGQGYYLPSYEDMGAVLTNTTPTEWADTPRWKRGVGQDIMLPWGKRHDMGSNYDPKNRDSFTLRSTLNPAGRELPTGDPFEDGPGYKRDTFTATVHSPSDKDIFKGNRSKSGAPYVVHGKANVAGNASERVVRVSTPARADMAARAMANRVEKTGDPNVRPVNPKTKHQDSGRVGKGKGVVAPPQGAVRAERKRKQKDEAGW